jgi:hypothetical protein
MWECGTREDYPGVSMGPAWLLGGGGGELELDVDRVISG